MPARTSRLAHPQHRVSAVLVAHDGGRWLAETLRALARQTRPAQYAVAVDVGSEDESPDLLLQAVAEDHLVTVPRSSGFGASVAAGVLRLDELRAGARPAPPGTVEWVWLLHDDFAPEPTALEALLDAAEDMPSAVVLGPKARDWDDPRLLVEVGVTIDRAGRRETGLERREYDQGQHDAVRDVLAVGTAGCLVRRDVWDELGGLDPRLTIFRDDVDFGWRVAAAGHRVVVVPSAVGRHARAAWTGRRHLAAAHGTPTGLDRRHSIALLLANLPLPVLLGAVPRLLVGAVLRTLAFLLTRQVTAARDELAAVWWNVRHLGQVPAARSRRRGTQQAGWAAVKPLLAGRTARLRGYLEAAGDWLTGGGGGDELLESEPDDGSGEDVVGAALPRRGTRILRRRPGLALTLVLTLVSLVALRGLLGSGRLVGGALFPSPTGASDLWQAFAASWHRIGAGVPGSPSPALALLAALSTVLLGKAWLAVDLLLLGVVPLSGLAAYRAAKRFVPQVPFQLWAGAAYALLPLATGALAQGRLNAAVAHMAAPLLVVAGHRLLTADPKYAGWRHPFAAGLLLAVVTAFAPPVFFLAALFLPSAAGLALFTANASSRAGAVRRTVAVACALVSAFAVLAPWSFRLLAHPTLLLAGVGASPTTTPDALDLILLRPGGPGQPWPWVTAGLLLAALGALVRRDVRAPATAWLVAGLAWVISVFSVRGVGPLPEAYAGPLLSVAAAALLVAALSAAAGAREQLAAADFSWRQPVAVVIAVLAGLLPLVSAASWVRRGAADPLDRRPVEALPAVVRSEAGAQPGLRVLWLAPGGGTGADPGSRVRFALTPIDGLSLTTLGAPVDGPTYDLLERLVADLASQRGSDAAEALSTFAIRYVAVERPVDPTIAAALDTQSGLSRVPYVGAVQLWRTIAPAARLVALPAELAPEARAGRFPSREQLRALPPRPLGGGREAATVTVPNGPGGRMLVLAERADGRWKATTAAGEELPEVRAWGWAQAFELPSGTLAVTVFRDQSGRHVALVIQGLVLLLVVVLAAPSVRRGIDTGPAARGDEDDADEDPVEPDDGGADLVHSGNVRRLS